MGSGNERRELQLALWRSVAAQPLRGVVEEIVPPLAAALPHARLRVLEIDLPRRALEPAAALESGDGSSPFAHLPLSEEDLGRLLSWVKPGRIARGRGDEIAAVVAPLAARGERSLLVGALFGAKEPLGLLVLARTAGPGFTVSGEDLVRPLLEPLGVALENERMRRETAKLREIAEADRQLLRTRLGRVTGDDPIIGADGGLKPVLDRARLVARSDVPVLILGETGSGKEVIARAIHAGSRRAEAPFLRVNCGAIPPELIDSELFGHERGSFSGAIGSRKGWFERADGGTLFLDEVGELPLAAQVRLLRILQDGTFERVGGQSSLHVDVRIVAATHRDLPAMVREGRFREDLWYRIAVFTIHLPALREHPEDVPALALHFALRAAKRFGLVPQVPTQDDVRLLVSYPWPGNVRELASVIERAAILGDGRALQIAKALGPLPENRDPPGSAAASHADEEGEAFPTLAEAMTRHIRNALARTGGRIEGEGGAASLLAINPHTLRARMRKLGIDWTVHRRR